MDSNDPPPGSETQSRPVEATCHTRCENECAGLSLRKVAEEAEKSRGLVHCHYDSKSDLLASLLDYLVERFEVRFGEPEGASALDDGALRERPADVRGFGDWSSEFITPRGFGRLSMIPRTERRLAVIIATPYRRGVTTRGLRPANQPFT